MVATINNYIGMLEQFRLAGADLDAKCTSGTTALMHAASDGDLGIVKVAILLPSPSAAASALHHTLILFAFISRKYLHDHGIDLQENIDSHGWTAAAFAARAGQMEVCTMHCLAARYFPLYVWSHIIIWTHT